jgi:NTE family protein
MRVGLVLGAGGVVGASWLIGALEALQDETGWEPSAAEVIVGTSAGSVVGALTASGMPPA